MLPKEVLDLDALKRITAIPCPSCKRMLLDNFSVSLRYDRVAAMWRASARCARCEGDLTDLARVINAMGGGSKRMVELIAQMSSKIWEDPDGPQPKA